MLLISFILSGLISSISVPYFINKSLGGHNGDSYGASLVITETTNLLDLLKKTSSFKFNELLDFIERIEKYFLINSNSFIRSSNFFWNFI